MQNDELPPTPKELRKQEREREKQEEQERKPKKLTKEEWLHKLYVTAPEIAREKARERQLINNYGITAKQFYEMLRKQNGMCAICGTTNSPKHFCVDHDHQTLEIRGLLCQNCNLGIGLLGDTAEGIFKALQYFYRFHTK